MHQLRKTDIDICLVTCKFKIASKRASDYRRIQQRVLLGFTLTLLDS